MTGVYQDPTNKDINYTAEPLTNNTWKLTKHDESEQYMCRIKTDKNGQQSFHSIQLTRDTYKSGDKPDYDYGYPTSYRRYVNPDTCKFESIIYIMRPILIIPLRWKVKE